MFAEYLRVAMRDVHYEDIDEDGTIFATIPGFDGLWANAATRSQVNEELESALEGWVLVNIAHHRELPIRGGIDLTVREVA